MRTRKALSVALILAACVGAFLVVSGRVILIGQTAPVAVDKSNIDSTVIKDGYHTHAEIYGQ